MTSINPYPAPSFNLKNSEAVDVKLNDYAGRWLVVYFYPKDDTPGCTTQACSLRDQRDEITALGAEVIGISRDDAASHEKFKAKHSLNFTLLSDPDAKVIAAYGVWGKKAFGREGILRKTFIINPKGQVVKVFARATPLGHGKAVVDELKKHQAANVGG